MPQSDILDQLIKYLDITSGKYLEELENQEHAAKDKKTLASIQNEKKSHLDYISKFKQFLNNGYCHGFAVCHGAMDLLGKQEWWENVLLVLAKWDGKPES